jgi:hypothetical protein
MCSEIETTRELFCLSVSSHQTMQEGAKVACCANRTALLKNLFFNLDRLCSGRVQISVCLRRLKQRVDEGRRIEKCGTVFFCLVN